MKLVFMSNFMVDMVWVLSAMPQLLRASHLIICHGEDGRQCVAAA